MILSTSAYEQSALPAPAGFGRVATKPRPNADGSTGGKSPYRLGRAFEQAVRGRAQRRGYFVMRATMSKGKIDLLCVKAVAIANTAEQAVAGEFNGQRHIVLGIQCKRRGSISSTEWGELMDVCEPHGIMPVVAVKVFETGANSVAFYRLDQRREFGKRGRPWTQIDLATGEPLPVQTTLV